MLTTKLFGSRIIPGELFGTIKICDEFLGSRKVRREYFRCFGVTYTPVAPLKGSKSFPNTETFAASFSGTLKVCGNIFGCPKSSPQTFSVPKYSW